MYRRPCGNLSPWRTIPPVPDLLICQTGVRRCLSHERGIKRYLVFSNVNSKISDKSEQVFDEFKQKSKGFIRKSVR